MSICPKCKKIINHLREVRSGVEGCDMFWNEKGNYLDYENEEFSGDGSVLLYYCPECSEELDFNDEEAEEFLKNKDEVAEMVAKKINMNNEKFSPEKLNQIKEKK